MGEKSAVREDNWTSLWTLSLCDFSAANEWFADSWYELVTESVLVRLSTGILLMVLSEGHFILCLFALSDMVNQLSKINWEA